MPEPTQPDGLYFFLETIPGDSLAQSRAVLTRVDAWLDFDGGGRPCRASGGGRILARRVGAGDPGNKPTTEAFVASGDSLPGLPLSWGQLYTGSPEATEGGGARDISKWLRWVAIKPLPAGCKVRTSPDGVAEVLYPDGSLATVYPPTAE